MKYRFLYILLVAFLFTANPSSFAAFRVKKAAIAATSAGAATGVTTLINGAQLHKLHRMSPSHWPGISGSNNRPSEWMSWVAFGSGFLGMFIPGLNFAAILFGLLGMRKGNTMKGLAIAGFALGVLELLLFVFFETTIVALISL